MVTFAADCAADEESAEASSLAVAPALHLSVRGLGMPYQPQLTSCLFA